MKTNCFYAPFYFLVFVGSAAAVPRPVPLRATPGEPPTQRMARVDYGKYPHIPDCPTSLVYRAVLKSIPYTRSRAFHGNYAGSGNSSGPPVDEVDEVYRRHDIVYAECRSLACLRWADEASVEALSKIDASTLSPAAVEFRDRSAAFFSNPRLTLVGKPVSSYIFRREEKDCPFQTRAEIRAFFGLRPDGANTAGSIVAKEETKRRVRAASPVPRRAPKALARKSPETRETVRRFNPPLFARNGD